VFSAQIDQAEAFAQTNALRRKVEIVSGELAVLAIACSLLFAQLISRPMNQLSSRARLLQAGDYDSIVPVNGPSEVRTFARTFEAMARSLRDSHMALVKSTEHIGNILESINEGFFAFDREWTCPYVNGKAVVLTGVPREELLGKKLQELIPNAVSGRERSELDRVAIDSVPVQFEHYHAPMDAWFEVSAYPDAGKRGRGMLHRFALAESFLRSRCCLLILYLKLIHDLLDVWNLGSDLLGGAARGL
jgi:PAS domain-containing protein